MANLKLIEVRDVGTDKEMVFMRATKDLDLGDYIVTDTTYRSTGATSNKLRHVFEFPTHAVKEGQYVALYSAVGTNKLSETVGPPKIPVHVFYWNLKERIWNQTGDRAYLLYAPKQERQTVAVPEVKLKAK